MATTNNKIQLANGTVLLDLTSDTVTAETLLRGYTAHDASGALITGTYEGGGGVVVVETPDSHGGTIVEITGEEIRLQAKGPITPTETAQTIESDSGYTGLSRVSLAAIAGNYVGSGVTRRTSTDLIVNGATVQVPGGYYATTASKSVASGTAGTPTATKSAVNNHAITVTPSVTNVAGYISGGTVNGNAVSVAASELVSGNRAITENGTNIDVTNYATVSVDVAGSTGKNVQAYRGYATVTATSYTATTVSITVAKTGTYNVSWMGYRNTNSGTSGSQLYRTRNGSATAIGSASTTFVNTYGHSVSLTNQSFQEGDILVVRARARSTSYVMAVGNLIIEEV